MSPVFFEDNISKPLTEEEADIIRDACVDIKALAREGLPVRDVFESVNWLQDYVEDINAERIRERKEKEE